MEREGERKGRRKGGKKEGGMQKVQVLLSSIADRLAVFVLGFDGELLLLIQRNLGRRSDDLRLARIDT